MKRAGMWILAAAVSFGLPMVAQARVKLITLPVRERVEVQLDHPNATLVEEERIVPLNQGDNQVDFSWAGTNIDPGTIVFRVLGSATDSPNQVNVLSVSYPPGENALVWDVSASASGPVRVRISYLLGGLDKSFNYRAVAGQDEKFLELRQYIRVRNFANEAFRDTTIHAGYGGRFTKPIGLNETREMLFERFAQVPVVKTYTADAARFGYLDQPQQKLNVPMHYVLINDDEHALGKAPLPAGKVRIFQKDNAGTTAFLGEDWGVFTPIDDKMKLYLGLAQDVAVKRTIESRERKRVVGNLYNYHVVVKYEIENFKDQPVTLNVAELIEMVRQEAGIGANQPAEWEIGDKTDFEGKPNVEETDATRIEYSVDLPPRKGDEAQKIEKRLEIIFRNEW
jgi:hypothetical protein